MEYQEAFNTIKEFYDHAWATLLTVVGILFGLLGVIYPLLINNIQSKANSLRLKNLEKEYEKQKKAIEAMSTESRIAMGGIYLHQGNLQFLEYKTYDGKSGIDPFNIYLSYLKSLNCFLDASNMKYVDIAYEQLEQISDIFDFSKTNRYYSESKDIYNQIVEKLEKNKDIELCSSILSYLKNIFCTIEHNNKQAGE